MPELVERSPVPIDRRMKRRLRGHLHVIQTWRVERLATTDANIGTAVADHPVGFGNHQHRIGQGRDGGQLLGQTLALVDIEHGEALQKRNGSRLAVLAASLLGLTLGGKAIGITDHRAGLAAPDMPTCGFCLPVGQPPPNTKPALDDCAPEDQHIDPGIGPPGHCIVRHGTGTPRCIPRLHPWQPSLFQLTDDPRRDLAIKALAFHNTHDLFSCLQTAMDRRRGGGGRQEGPQSPAG